MLKELINDLNTFSVTATDCIDFNKFHLYILLSGKTFAKKKIRADTSREVSNLLVIFVFEKK